MTTLQDALHQVAGGAFPINPPPINGATLVQPSALSFIAQDVAAALASAKPVAAAPAPAGARYPAIYAFGDSLTDTGNVSLATLGTVPVSPPYADRSFTNGPVWVQDLAHNLGLPPLNPSLAGGTDFAYGGAETGQTPVHTLNPTDLMSQYTQFLTQAPTPQPGSLYAVWIGSNDVLDIANNSTLTPPQQQTAVADAVNNEVAVIGGLAAHGAQNLLVLNVPDLGKTPYEQARGASTAQTATSLASLYNTELAAALQPLEASGALRIDLVNTLSVLDQAAANPSAGSYP